ncbi:hypothetical protein BD413DRAFT_30141 [Trametes elegans]|nr:hypothetical protein BD413DRAFT_30141 [Trametes elegans]
MPSDQSGQRSYGPQAERLRPERAASFYLARVPDESDEASRGRHMWFVVPPPPYPAYAGGQRWVGCTRAAQSADPARSTTDSGRASAVPALFPHHSGEPKDRDWGTTPPIGVYVLGVAAHQNAGVVAREKRPPLHDVDARPQYSTFGPDAVMAHPQDQSHAANLLAYRKHL